MLIFSFQINSDTSIKSSVMSADGMAMYLPFDENDTRFKLPIYQKS